AAASCTARCWGAYRGGLAVPLRLQGEQACVTAVEAHQLLVAALLDDAPAVEHGDLVGYAHRGETVGNQNRDALARELAEMLEHFGFRLRVHRCRRLVQHENVRPRAHEGARQRDLLPLPA